MCVLSSYVVPKKITMTKEYLNQLTYKIIGATIEVHKSIGPGLLEKIYHRCLSHEFLLQGIKFQSEFNIPINYKGSKLSADLRCDFLVEDAIVLEIKASLTMLPVFDAQIISYMKLLKVPKGILINFQSDNIFNNGQKTFVNEIFSALPDR